MIFQTLDGNWVCELNVNVADKHSSELRTLLNEFAVSNDSKVPENDRHQLMAGIAIFESMMIEAGDGQHPTPENLPQLRSMERIQLPVDLHADKIIEGVSVWKIE